MEGNEKVSPEIKNVKEKQSSPEVKFLKETKSSPEVKFLKEGSRGRGVKFKKPAKEMKEINDPRMCLPIKTIEVILLFVYLCVDIVNYIFCNDNMPLIVWCYNLYFM